MEIEGECCVDCFQYCVDRDASVGEELLDGGAGNCFAGDPHFAIEEVGED